VGVGRWQPVPKRVVGLKRVARVAAGPEHTVVLVSPSYPAVPHSQPTEHELLLSSSRASPASFAEDEVRLISLGSWGIGR
jgi:hypothetical protein